MENITYNQRDVVMVQLQKYTFYTAQVFKDEGDMIHIILKEDSSNRRTFLYDKEFSIIKNMIVKKLYDYKTDKDLVESEN